MSRVVEATNGFNWGKFLLAYMDREWEVPAAVFAEGPEPPARAAPRLLSQLGWTPHHLWVLDLATGEGALFYPSGGGVPKHDLEKHRVWVCPLFEPFLEWLYRDAPRREHGGTPGYVDLAAIPALVQLPEAPAAMYGYRRGGREP